MGRRWEKLGHLYSNPGLHPKLVSHAANPTPVHLDGDVYRVFFSARDDRNRSSVGAVDIDIAARRVLREHAEPALVHGPEGSYFEAGISIGNCHDTASGRYILFMGWQQPPGGHWFGEVGRIVVADDLSLRVEDPGTPFLPRDATDPVSLSYPWVMADGAGGYAMWYGSTVTWDTGNGEMLHTLNAATSPDGDIWTRSGVAVPFQLGVAQAFSKPAVLRHADGSADMWFSYRGTREKPYRIGYAHSPDGRAWRLALEDTGIDVDPDPAAWDGQMIEYPHVFAHGGDTFMLYNGNGFGKSGFGLAVLRD